MNQRKILRELFLSTFMLSACTFGGGYVIVSLMKKKFVDELHWIEENEMLDLIAIAQSCPGAVAVNGAIVLGMKLAGLTGVITAVIATVLPPFLIISIISFFYQAFKANAFIALLLKGMQAGIAAVILSVVVDMSSHLLKEKNTESVVILVLAFVLNFCFDVSVIIILMLLIVYTLIKKAVMRT